MQIISEGNFSTLDYPSKDTTVLTHFVETNLGFAFLSSKIKISKSDPERAYLDPLVEGATHLPPMPVQLKIFL